jgi:hypothetical protein
MVKRAGRPDDVEPTLRQGDAIEVYFSKLHAIEAPCFLEAATRSLQDLG